jgi:hypothetical protein
MLGWALNEEENIGRYIDRAGAFLSALTDRYELILIDDGSSDRTWSPGHRSAAHTAVAEGVSERT